MSDSVLNGKTLSPERIFLQKDVKFILKRCSTLTSDEANIDCLELSGVFTSVAPNRVVYTTFIGEDDKKLPVTTSSMLMNIKMKKDEKLSQYVLSDVKCEGSVLFKGLYNKIMNQQKIQK